MALPLKNKKARKALKALRHASDKVDGCTIVFGTSIFMASLIFPPFGNRYNTVCDLGISLASGIIMGALGYGVSYLALDISPSIRRAKKDLEKCVKDGSIIIKLVHDGKKPTWRAFDNGAHPYDLGEQHGDKGANSAEDIGVEIQGFNLLGFLSNHKLNKISQMGPPS